MLVMHVDEGSQLNVIAATDIERARLFGDERSILKSMIGVVVHQALTNLMYRTTFDHFDEDLVETTVTVSLSASSSRGWSTDKG